MDINELRHKALSTVTYESAMQPGSRVLYDPPPQDAGIVLALIYLGDSIREGTSDIGPAIEKSAEEARVGHGSIAEALNDLGNEIAHQPTTEE